MVWLVLDLLGYDCISKGLGMVRFVGYILLGKSRDRIKDGITFICQSSKG